MDIIYDQLLRSGKSSMKRHEALQGKLNQETKLQNSEYARTEAILNQPTIISPSSKTENISSTSSSITEISSAIPKTTK